MFRFISSLVVPSFLFTLFYLTPLQASTYLGSCCVVIYWSNGSCHPEPGEEYQFTEEDGTYKHKACGSGGVWYNKGENEHSTVKRWYYPGKCQGCVYPVPE